MQVFDASSLIYAWDNYPLAQFPGVWNWLEDQIEARTIKTSQVALGEVLDIAPDCHAWLTARNIESLPVTNQITQQALTIKGLLGIVNDSYHAKGVGENDLLILSTAKVHQFDLVSDEAVQNNPPNEPRKRKIPAVCAMQQVQVNCQSFVEFLKASNEVF